MREDIPPLKPQQQKPLQGNETRCAWCTRDENYIDYHDTEWGRPVGDDRELFERLVLEGMQAGLSWITVLKKRDVMRHQFRYFDIPWLAVQDESRLQEWLSDPGLIRHRGKLSSVVTNARCVLEFHGSDARHTGESGDVLDGDSFAGWLWSFAPRAHIPCSDGRAPAYTKEAQAMAKALKARGFRFVGPTTCYAFMQSVGMVNDHLPECLAYDSCLAHWQHPLRPS